MSSDMNNISLLVFLSLCGWICCEGLVLQGEWHSRDSMFLFLTKFGFQKTNPHEGALSEGYIFGNITSLKKQAGDGSELAGGLLVLLPRQYFLSFYSNRTQPDTVSRDLTCQRMFKDVLPEAYDARCHDIGREDFLRHVPCPRGQLCLDEDNPSSVVAHSQLTYQIMDVNNPRFWYLSLVACRLNASCGWQHSGDDISLTYHLTLVNGKPPAADHDFFAYHFSCDQQDVGELVLFCLLVYGCVLLPVQLYATCKQRLRVLEVFACVLALQTLGLVFTATSQVVLGASGRWLAWAGVGGEVCTVLCEAVFLVLLLLLARGWAVTNTTGHHTTMLYVLWGTYTALTILLYCWNKVMVSVVENVYQYGAWPGVMALLLRGLITAWYLWELRTTMLSQHQHNTLHFLLQLGAASLVWLVYLPVVALIALQVSPLWRHKLLLGFRYSADLLAHVFMAYILYPRRSHPYLVLATPQDHCDELDVLDQAPHVLHRRLRRGGRRSSSTSSLGRKLGRWSGAGGGADRRGGLDEAGFSSGADGDEMVEFERLPAASATETAPVYHHNNGNAARDAATNGNPSSKFKVQVNRSNGFYSTPTNYMPLSRNILDITQQDSYTHIGAYNNDSVNESSRPNGVVLSSIPSSVRDAGLSVTALGHLQGNNLTQLSEPVVSLIQLDDDSGNSSNGRFKEVDPLESNPVLESDRAGRQRLHGRADGTASHGLLSLDDCDGFGVFASDEAAAAEGHDYYCSEASDASDSELLVVVKGNAGGRSKDHL